MIDRRLGYFASLLLIISFVGLAVFSFAIFNHDLDHSTGGCLAGTITGVACPTNIIEFAIHHMAALRTFSKTLVSLIFVLLLTPILLFLVPIPVPPLPQNRSRPKPNFGCGRQKFIRWLMLLEHSPSA